MKKESSKKLNLSKIKIANLSMTTASKKLAAPTTTVWTSKWTIC
ncbi:hypothetical protein [Chitinophaga sp. YR573]|nr:hypothetical protein [Chitinophaga sp. YR573]